MKILLMSTCMNKSMVSQQILTAVMTCIVVDKNTVHAKPHSSYFLPQHQRELKKSLLRLVDNWKHRLRLESACAVFIYIYTYTHIHPFTKTLLFQKYISYICITVKKRLKQGEHISSVIPLWPLLSVFYTYVCSDVDKKDTSAEKA